LEQGHQVHLRPAVDPAGPGRAVSALQLGLDFGYPGLADSAGLGVGAVGQNRLIPGQFIPELGIS
jgi:hypothetical protein